MTQPHYTHEQDGVQEHPLIAECLAALQEIDEKALCEKRFYDLISSALILRHKINMRDTATTNLSK